MTYTVYPKKCAHGFCFAVLCCGYTLTDFPYPSGLLHWHCGNLTIAPVPAKQPWWIWINTSCEFIMNDCISTTKQSTTKPCAYFLGYTVVLINIDTSKRCDVPLTWITIYLLYWLCYYRTKMFFYRCNNYYKDLKRILLSSWLQYQSLDLCRVGDTLFSWIHCVIPKVIN